MFEIGSSLRDARERQGLDFLQAELATKIRAKYLRALEDEQFDILPGETYVKGFLRAYADFLGLDGQLYVDEYTSRFVVEDESRPRRARRSSVRPRRHPRFEQSAVLASLAAIGILTALIIAAWKFGGGGGGSAVPGAAKSTPPAVARRGQANLVVQAVRGDSLVIVRAGSVTGRLLYEGTLERPQSKRFVATRLWVTVGSPENLWLRLNGRPVRVGGGCPRVLVITAKQITSTAHCD